MARWMRWAWIAVLALALTTRLPALGRVPLAPDEAARALDALDAAEGRGWPLATESPLLLVGTALLFELFGAGDALARLLPALAGVALVMLPWLWRRRLGEVSALAAAVLLLVAPQALFAARRAESTTLGVLGAALLLTPLLRSGDACTPQEDRRRSAALVALGLALGLTGGAGFYDALFGGLFAVVFYTWALRSARGASEPAASEAVSEAMALEAASEETATPEVRSVWRALRSRPVVMGLLVALLVSVGLGWRWGGWGGLFEGLAAWLASWRAGRLAHLGLPLLLLYAPLTLLLALFGLVRSFARPEPLPLGLALWSLAALLLASLRPGASPLALVSAVVPLALLAGHGVEVLRAGLGRDTARWVGIHGLVASVFWVPVVTSMAGHANGVSLVGSPALILFGAVVLLSLQVLLVLLFSLLVPLRLTWRGALLGLALPLLLVQVRFAWGLSFLRATSPVEPVVPVAASPDLRALRETVDEIAVQQDQRRDAFDVTLLAADEARTAVLRWTLRDYDRLRVASAWPLDGAEVAPGVVVSAPEASASLPEGTPWRGMRFVALARGDISMPSCESLYPTACQALARWYLFRQSAIPAAKDEVVLWRAQ